MNRARTSCSSGTCSFRLSRSVIHMIKSSASSSKHVNHFSKGLASVIDIHMHAGHPCPSPFSARVYRMVTHLRHCRRGDRTDLAIHDSVGACVKS